MRYPPNKIMFEIQKNDLFTPQDQLLYNIQQLLTEQNQLLKKNLKPKAASTVRKTTEKSATTRRKTT